MTARRSGLPKTRSNEFDCERADDTNFEFEMTAVDFIFQFLGPTGSIAVLFGAIYKAFGIVDTNSSKDANARYSSVIKSGEYRNFIHTFPKIILPIFKQIFGNRHLSIKCIRRSIEISIISMTISFAFSVLHHWNHFYHDLIEERIATTFLRDLIINMVILYACWSLIPDYLNLWKTRALLQFFANRQRSHPIIFMVFVACADLIGGFIVFYTIIGVLIFRTTIDWEMFQGLVYELPFANLFWAGMVPSLWLWLNLMAVTFTTLMNKSSRYFEFMFHRLDVEEHPIRSVGFVAATTVCALYGIGAGIKFVVT
jgi:hypothetical protein